MCFTGCRACVIANIKFGKLAGQTHQLRGMMMDCRSSIYSIYYISSRRYVLLQKCSGMTSLA